MEVEQGFLEQLAERVGATAKATEVFGAPVERDGVTVIPVAKARWGFGGGSGSGPEGGGGGGGGGAMVSPIGYIELRDGRSRFRPVFDPAVVALLAAVGLLVLSRRRSPRP